MSEQETVSPPPDADVIDVDSTPVEEPTESTKEKKPRSRTRTVQVPAELLDTNPKPLAVVAEQPSALLKLAVEQGFDIDRLEKLLQLQRDWQREEARKAFADALSKFQSEIPPIVKSSRVNAGNAGKRKFASLGTINEVIQPYLYSNGLSFRFRMEQGQNGISVTCIVSHRDGHNEETTMTAGADVSGGKNPIQSIASTVTYLERYTLTAALGLTTVDEDSDGEPQGEQQLANDQTPEQRRQAAMELARQAAAGIAGQNQATGTEPLANATVAQPQQSQQPANQQPQQPTESPKVGQKDLAEMMGLMKRLFSSGAEASQWLAANYQTPDPTALTESQATDVLIYLNRKVSEAALPTHPGPSPDEQNRPANDPAVQQAERQPGEDVSTSPAANSPVTMEQRQEIQRLTIKAYAGQALAQNTMWLQSLGLGNPSGLLYGQADERIGYLQQVTGEVPF